MRLDKNKRLKNSLPDNFKSCENSDIIVPRVLLRAVLTTKKNKKTKKTETQKSTPTKTTFRSNNNNKG